MIKDFITMKENQIDFVTKYFFTNNRDEYINLKLRLFFVGKGIMHDLAPLYTVEYNCVPK